MSKTSLLSVHVSIPGRLCLLLWSLRAFLAVSAFTARTGTHQHLGFQQQQPSRGRFDLFSATQDVATTQAPSSKVEEADSHSVKVIMDALEKRLGGNSQEGVLSEPETRATIQATDVLIKELKSISISSLKVPTSVPKTIVSPRDLEDLRKAVLKVNATAVSALIEAGVEMDEKTTNAAFWSVVKAVDHAEKQDQPLSADVPQMLHHIFDADLRHLLSREKLRTNVTCMQPQTDDMEGSARRMNYVFDDSAHKDLPLSEGRVCEGGTCCAECSRNIFPTFATEAETDFEMFPKLGSLTFNQLRSVSAGTIIQFVRLMERVRRTIAHEYGLPRSSILPLQAYSRKYVAGTTQQGGGGGEGDFVILHTDEATHSGYHYSCVLYLSTQGEDFEGGEFVFNDPAETSSEESSTDADDETDDEYDEVAAEMLEDKIRSAGRKLTPFRPTRGAGVIFSSGWENMHEVNKITSGTRYVVPCFFTTCPVPEAAYDQMAVGKPKTNEDIADDWLHLLLAHRQETPQEAVGRVKELLMKWHYMCTPLSEH